jgi:hypothetical protein
MNWLILGVTLLIVLVPSAVLQLRHASRTLDAIMAEHRQRVADGTAADTVETGLNTGVETGVNTGLGSGLVPRRSHARHRLQGRRPRTIRVNPGYATHRRMSA